MEFNYSHLQEAIYYYLSLHPDTKFTSYEIFNGLIDEKICPELVTKSVNISSECNKVAQGYENIEHESNKYCLKLKNKPIYDFDEIENIISHMELYPALSFTDVYANDQSMLHILCECGKTQLLEKLGHNFVLDLSVKNKKGQTLLDVIPKTENGSNTSKLLFKLLFEQINGKNLETKQKNSNLQSKNNELVKNLVIEKANTQRENMFKKLLMALFVMLFVANLMLL